MAQAKTKSITKKMSANRDLAEMASWRPPGNFDIADLNVIIDALQFAADGFLALENQPRAGDGELSELLMKWRNGIYELRSLVIEAIAKAVPKNIWDVEMKVDVALSYEIECNSASDLPALLKIIGDGMMEKENVELAQKV